ncbi:hypothetical protein AVEN_225516-1 [Araneus ventricosus]|uniref:Uncharacterized protein n=1 Tax=Araneus ventricosus TaxID=182803 RepID=A0A4Y2TDZ7_ARAVE|nr:hypothetical protein AVEN_225516-1 [Araneus ventricosus]
MKQHEGYFRTDLVILIRDEDAPSPNFRTTPAGVRLAPYLWFNVQQAPYTTDLQGNRVSNVEPSGSEAIPLGHCGLQCILRHCVIRYWINVSANIFFVV